MTFPLDGCIIPRPCKAPKEQGLSPCPSRLGTAQTRETEAQPGAETPEDPNPPSKPPRCWRTHARASTGPSTPRLAAPCLQTIASTLGCPQPAPGACWGLCLASPGQGTAGTALPAPACTLLPAAKEASNSSCLEKNNFRLRKGRASTGKRRGWRQHPGDTGTCCSASPVPCTHPLSPVSPVPSQPARPGREAAALRLRRTKEQAPNNGAGPPCRAMPPRQPLPPPGPTAQPAGTGAQPGQQSGWQHRGPLCWCRVPEGDMGHPQLPPSHPPSCSHSPKPLPPPISAAPRLTPPPGTLGAAFRREERSDLFH